MQAIASALGVSCDYCHKNMRGRAADGETPVPEPEKAVALAMMAMTRDLNARVQSATGKPAGEATTVRCVTCHRGVPIPRPLDEIVFQAVLRDGAPAAAAQYRDLRQRYFGRGTYDFGEEALLGVARRFAQSRPPDAITLLEMNLEFHPESADGYAALGYAYTRLGDDGSALTYLEKALELQPENGTVRGQVEQLRRFQRR
jgi:tetratricopeptide (TPR) repeat protein